MGKNKFTRILALCLAVVCLVSVASALSFDLSGDGKTDVWDLQLAVKEGKTDTYADALAAALGGTDELRPNAEGVYEIYSLVGLFNMANHAKEGASFKLMNDIDMMGIDWTPVEVFKGNFDGNNKTISNVTITKSRYGSDGDNMGFFALVDHNGKDADGNNLQSEVKNLHLRDVNVIIAEDAGNIRWVGLLAGSNRGIITNCTTTGTITDNRTVLADKSYFGSIIGRNNDSKPKGVLKVSNAMDALEYYDYEPVKNATKQTDPYKGALKVSSQLAMFFADLEEGSPIRVTGIAGYSVPAGLINSATGASGKNSGLLFQDTTNSSKYDDPELLERRTTVAAAMYEMSTVEWTPSQTLRYIRRTVVKPTTAAKPTTTYTKGNVYHGIPYNHGSSGIDRFLAYMEVDANGRYTTVSTLPTVAIYFTGATGKENLNKAYEEYHAEGTTADRKNALVAEYPELLIMTQKMPDGNQIGFNMYIGADCSSQATWAWRAISATTGTDFAKPTSTSDMYISQQWITKSGIVPVNGFILEDPEDLDGDGSKNGSGDKSIYVKNYTRANKNFYMETLTYVTKGDLLMDYTGEGGHTLLAMSDAVTIRDYNGALNLDKSYIITAEQGGGGGTRKGTTADGKDWSSSCCVDEVNSFNKLYAADSTTEETPKIFFPITCTALKVVDTPAATATCTMSKGTVTSNFHIVSTTVGEETVYTNIAHGGHRNPCNTLTVATAHPNVQTGDTVKVLLANGETYTFTY